MSDAELRTAERRWREERTTGAARAYAAARLRRGVLDAGERGPLRTAASRGDEGAAEALLLDGWLREDPGDVRVALAALDGTPGEDADAPMRYREGVVRVPCALEWRSPRQTSGERFVAGWLATLAPADRVFLWTRAVLAEPAVTDTERRAVLAAALRGVNTDLDLLAARHAAIVETVTWPVLYVSGSYLEGGPPTIERTFPWPVHGLLRRGLLVDLREGQGPDAAVAVLRAILERPESLVASRPEVRLSTVQAFGVWNGVAEPGPRHERARGEAARQLIDSFSLRGALSLIAVAPELLADEEVAAAIQWLCPSPKRLPHSELG